MTPEIARQHRIQMYAQWLLDDADGLSASLLMKPAIDYAPAMLAGARDRLTAAIERIDQAISEAKSQESAR